MLLLKFLREIFIYKRSTNRNIKILYIKKNETLDRLIIILLKDDN